MFAAEIVRLWGQAGDHVGVPLLSRTRELASLEVIAPEVTHCQRKGWLWTYLRCAKP